MIPVAGWHCNLRPSVACLPQTMKSLAGRLFLMLVLVLNGPGAAWSMHGAGSMQRSAAVPAEAQTEPGEHHCAGVQDRDGVDQPTLQRPAPSGQHSPAPSGQHTHCGGIDCHCGCAVAAIISHVMTRDLPSWSTHAPRDASRTFEPSYRLTPPFRPPAV